MIAINSNNRNLLVQLNLIVPLFTIHLCLILAALAGHIRFCLPYIDNCTSISGTGKLFPEYLVFKLGMIPAALFLALLWRQMALWLKALGDNHLYRRILPTTGYMAGGCLLVYALLLGSWREDQEMIRRTLVSVYFGFSFLCQCLFLHRAQLQFIQAPPVRWMTRIAFFVLCFGIAEVVVDRNAELSERWFSPVEWWMALLLHLQYLLLWWLLIWQPPPEEH